MADNFKFVQNQFSTLAGSGCTIGATSITLVNFTQIDGTLLTMTDFGTVGFGTLEPGNGTREEQICWTGIVQNANGTATLTGVKNVKNVAPYTQTSGTFLSHPGGVKFIVSNTAGFYDGFVAKADDETITGTHTYTSPAYPRMDTATPAPVDDEQFATKKYVDDTAVSGAPNATTTVKGIVQLPTQVQVDAKTAVGSTGASLTLTPDKQRSTLLSDYVIDTGSANAYVITPAPAIAAYTAGQVFTFKAIHTNTTTSTLNVNALGTKTIKKTDGTVNLGAGDIVNGQIIQVEYDGTNFQMLSPAAASVVPSISSGNINEFLTTTDGSSLVFARPFDYQSFTSSGTWTKPTNLSGNEMIVVQAWGAGGGGGGSASSGSVGIGGGGGGGAFNTASFRASDLGATVTVTVGLGGAGVGVSVTGNVGGNTTFGALLTAYGGGGGTGGTGSPSSSGSGGGGGNSAAGSNGALGSSGTTGSGGAGGGIAGGAGSNSTVGGDSAFGGAGGGSTGGASTYGGGGGAINGAGGNSIYGGGGGGGSAGAGGLGVVFGGNGGAASNVTAPGGDGVAPGGGGGGHGTGGTGTFLGGSGARGEVRVWTFF